MLKTKFAGAGRTVVRRCHDRVGGAGSEGSVVVDGRIGRLVSGRVESLLVLAGPVFAVVVSVARVRRVSGGGVRVSGRVGVRVCGRVGRVCVRVCGRGCGGVRQDRCTATKKKKKEKKIRKPSTSGE